MTITPNRTRPVRSHSADHTLLASQDRSPESVAPIAATPRRTSPHRRGGRDLHPRPAPPPGKFPAVLNRDPSRQYIDHFIARIVDVQRRSTAGGHHFLEDRHAVAGLLAEQLEGGRPTGLHIPNGPLLW